MYAPHAVAAVLEQKGRRWLSNNQMLKYQALLLEQDDATLKTTSAVNPAMLRLWKPDVNEHGQRSTGSSGLAPGHSSHPFHAPCHIPGEETGAAQGP